MKSTLEKLSDGGVFYTSTFRDNRTIGFMDCDGAYKVHLTKDEVIELCNELMQMANQLHDCEWDEK